MIDRTVIIFLCFAALVSTPVAFAEVVELKLQGGQSFRGEIVSADDRQVSFDTVDGSRITLWIVDLDARSIQVVYRHLRAAARTGRDRLDLGDFCRLHGLLLEAAAEFRAAREADPTLADEAAAGLAAVDEDLADRLATEGQRRLEGDDAEGALEVFEKVTNGYPATRAAIRVRPLAADARARIAAAAARRPPPPPDPPDPKPDEPKTEWQRALARIEAQRAEAEAIYVLGVEEEGKNRVGRALKAYRQAESALDGIAGTLASVAEAASRGRVDPGPSGLEDLAALGRRTEAVTIRLYMTLAHFHAGARQLHQARTYVNKTLALDPDHAGANDLRQTITEEILRGGR